MPTPLENAFRRLAALKAEILRVERFISDYREFSGDNSVTTETASTISLVNGGGNVSPFDAPSQAVDKSGEIPRMSRRRGGRPDEIAQMIERVIREIGEPMTRGQLVQALERRDVELPAADKARYIGTIIWRHKSIFVNVEGRGYWLRNIPLVTNQPSSHLSSVVPEADDPDA